MSWPVTKVDYWDEGVWKPLVVTSSDSNGVRWKFDPKDYKEPEGGYYFYCLTTPYENSKKGNYGKAN